MACTDYTFSVIYDCDGVEVRKLQRLFALDRQWILQKHLESGERLTRHFRGRYSCVVKTEERGPEPCLLVYAQLVAHEA